VTLVAQEERLPDCGHQSVPREVWILTLASMMVPLGYGVVAPVLPQYAHHFGVSIGAVTGVITAFSLARLCFAPIAGLAVQRLGERRVYVSALLTVSLSTGACAVAQTYWQLLLFRSFAGIGSIMFVISSLALMIRISPADMRGRIASMTCTAFFVASIGGPILGSLTAGLGLRAPFIIYAIALMFATVAVFYGLRYSVAEAPAVVTPPKVSVRAALRHRAYRAALLSNFAVGWSVLGTPVALLPLFVYEVLGRGVDVAGLALATFAVGNICGVIPSGYLSDRLGRRALLIGGLSVSAVATMSVTAATSLPLFLAATFVTGTAVGVFSSSQRAAIADILGSKARAGTAVAMFQMVSDLGAIVCSLVVGQIAEHLTFGWSFAISGTVLLVAAAGWVLAPETGYSDRSGAARLRTAPETGDPRS
jgi:MFS transporter, ACDE family, multidrug resistance protein